MADSFTNMVFPIKLNVFFCSTSFLLLVSLLISPNVNTQNVQKLDSLELELELTRDVKNKVEILINLTDKYLNNDPDRALGYSKSAYELSEKENYEEGLALSMQRMADIYWGKSQYKISIEYAVKTKDLAEKINLVSALAESQLTLGKIYVDLGEFEKSSGYFFEALKRFEQISDQKGIANALRLIGILFFNQENYEKSLEYNLKSLSISKKITYQEGISSSLNNIAANYGQLKEYDKIEKYLQEAVDINKKAGQRLWEGINYLNLGLVYEELKQYDSCLIYNKKALAIFEELNNIPFICGCYNNLSDYYSTISRNDTSLTYAMKSFKLASENKLIRHVREAAKKLQELYYSKNDFPNAFKYLTEQYNANDSLQIEKSMAKLAQLELTYKLEKEEQEKQLIQNKKEFNYKLVIISLAFILIIIVFVLSARQRIKSRKALFEKEKLENEINIKNKELTTNVLSLMKKNEMLSDISKKLLLLEKETLNIETKSAIDKIAKELQKSTEHKILEEFDLRFNQVHSDFYNNLTKKFPDLSSGELRLCAFLRLNMTTKEISDLTGQQISTLENARYRIRKKFGLANTDVNLVTFLSAF